MGDEECVAKICSSIVGIVKALNRPQEVSRFLFAAKAKDMDQAEDHLKQCLLARLQKKEVPAFESVDLVVSQELKDELFQQLSKDLTEF